MEDTKQERAININWRALFRKTTFRDVIILLLSIALIYIAFFKKPKDTSDYGSLNYLMQKEKEYNSKLSTLNDRIAITSAQVQRKLRIGILTQSDSLILYEEMDHLKQYQNELENLSTTKQNFIDQITSKNAPYITLKNIDGKNNNITITKSDMVVFLRFLFGMAEQMRDNRFELRTEEIDVNKTKVSFLIDKSLGNIWVFKNGRFDKVSIENLENERRNQESEKMLELIIGKTGGYVYDLTEPNYDSIRRKDSLLHAK